MPVILALDYDLAARTGRVERVGDQVVEHALEHDRVTRYGCACAAHRPAEIRSGDLRPLGGSVDHSANNW